MSTAREARARRPRVADLARHLDAHRPADAVEAVHLDRLRRALQVDHDPFDRDADHVHVTGSAIVLPLDGGGRTVLHRHKRLHRWLQPGGHVDPGEHAQDAALRESHEETGLDVVHPGTPTLVHVHVHDSGPHVHLDTRWLLVADPDQPFAPAAGESSSLAWFDEADLAGVTEDNVALAVRVARDHLAG